MISCNNHPPQQELRIELILVAMSVDAYLTVFCQIISFVLCVALEWHFVAYFSSGLLWIRLTSRTRIVIQFFFSMSVALIFLSQQKLFLSVVASSLSRRRTERARNESQRKLVSKESKFSVWTLMLALSESIPALSPMIWYLFYLTKGINDGEKERCEMERYFLS